MLIIALALLVMLAAAVFCAVRLTRVAPKPIAEVSPMKATLERRIREGADFRL